jgi:tRNA-uridine 2-sulfurtransferase
MSGGIDSSTAAALLVREGCEVVGVTMQVRAASAARPGSVAAHSTDAAVADAARACQRLGIPHHVIDLSQVFEREVLDGFTREYLNGRTPNPCMQCNQRIKFGSLAEHVKELGAEALATGHYVQIAELPGRLALHRAVDPRKDQSYFLAALNQEQLAFARFPLGRFTKAQIREKARDFGLAMAERRESQDLCFSNSQDFRNVLIEKTETPAPGPILSTDGKLLGRHKGLIYYTVGQRKGLNIAAPCPLYVVRLDPQRNAVIVGVERETYAGQMTVTGVHWSGLPPQTRPFVCKVQIRYRHTAAHCEVIPSFDKLLVVFSEPQKAVTPGQWAVFYNEDVVLAAGIIDDFAPVLQSHRAPGRH